VFKALNPLLGLQLLITYPGKAAALLGAIVLTITGPKHFMRTGAFRPPLYLPGLDFFVCPGLLLNYFGQGAHAIAHPEETNTNPFFALAPPGPAQLALVVLSIVAGIIASQALITGTYSLTRQAIQLGFSPG